MDETDDTTKEMGAVDPKSPFLRRIYVGWTLLPSGMHRLMRSGPAPEVTAVAP
jgi:hypothetical protein